jgi:hypothetical protein
MKIQSLFLCGFIAVTLSTRGFALTTECDVSLAYVHEHPKEWSVKATRKESGLIEFTVVRTLSEPKYLVAHLAVHHTGKLVATSDTPVFAKQKGNTFYFSISLEDIAESKFALSESGLGGTVNGVKMDIPIVGSNVYQFRLLDFVPTDVLNPDPGK